MIGLDGEGTVMTDEEPVFDVACIQLALGAEATIFHQSDPDLPGLLNEVLDETVAGAFIPIDFSAIIKKWPELEPKVWKALTDGRVVDVNTRERLIDIAGGGLSKNAKRYSLGGVAKRWCGVDLDKKGDTRKSYGDLIDVPLAWWPEEAKQYALDDVTYTLQAAERQESYAARFSTEHEVDLFSNAPHQARAHWALHLGAMHGMLTDRSRVAELKKLLSDKLEATRDELVEHKLVRWTGKKFSAHMARLQDVLRDAGATEHTEKCKCFACTKEGDAAPRLRADAETLEGLDLDDGHPMHAYRTYKRAEKMLGTYLAPFEKPLVRPRYTELVSNGRTSAGGDLRQNLPTPHILKDLLGINWGFRECLVPREGNVLICADYSKAELVSWAQVLIELFGWDAPTAALARALIAGRDVHDELLQVMGGGERTMAKAGNFGFMGGAGVDRIIGETLGKFGIRLDRDAVFAMREAWKHAWAGGWYFTWVQDNMNAGDGVMNFIHSSGRVATGLGYSDGCNYPFSGRTADATKDALWRIAVEMYTEPDSSLYGCRQPLYVHDENVLECPVEQSEAAAVRLEELMKSTYLEWCPDVPVGVDISIRDRYGK
jgi:hypothetical protein